MMTTGDQYYTTSCTTTLRCSPTTTWGNTAKTAGVVYYTQPQYQYIEYRDPRAQALESYVQAIKDKLDKEKENTMELYNVYLVYAEDRKNPVVKRVDGVLAKSAEDAKVKSGLMKEVDDAWDSDYLNFICDHIGTVNVKPKPSEVKSV